ncbi:MAG TPA: phosphatase PAP2 family protein [Firmicutes bacterium]|nr:phosphatase PAP2 family protein [Bacillota bacterium]
MTDTGMILWAQQYAAPALTAFFKAITFLGSLEFYMLAIPIIYWLVDKHFGFRFAVFFTLSAYINSGTKFIFRTERPPLNLRLVSQEGYSFPSGHAQGSTAFWGFLALELKDLKAFVLAAVMILLISFSRIFLGVHWPVDILGGLAIGLLLLFAGLTLSSFDPLKVPFRSWLIGSFATAAFLYALHPAGDGPMTVGFLLGALLGYRWEGLYVDFQEDAAIWQNIVKVILGIGVLFALRIVLKPVLGWLPLNLATISRYACLGLWASFGAPFVFMRLQLYNEKPLTTDL